MNTAWLATLQKKLIQVKGTEQGKLLSEKYSKAFPTSYTEDCTAETAILDIEQMEALSLDQPIGMSFYQTADGIHLKLFQREIPIPLSDVLPMLENMDLRTFNERPYHFTFKNSSIWVSDFNVAYTKSAIVNIDKIKDIFQETFLKVQAGLAENDGFNKLVLGAQLDWREITILRAYVKYVKQTGFRFSQPYIEQTLTKNAGIAKDLVDLFKEKFNPEETAAPETLLAAENAILQSLDKVTILDEDTILRQLLQLIKATTRTNYFQTLADDTPKNYLSFKLHSADIPGLPLPVPLYEIYVYSPRFEGIHLRNTKVARGGIRWSDRPEDFRTEILSLMKAQKVKNAVIVPSGAKGGFVLKCLPAQASREIALQEVTRCYQAFIRGLLDLTDNIKRSMVLHPPKVICYDENDTYLVVAADKGTATFSDIANAISKEYNFWLGDAFASGGSTGYDHKKMGITARGAWESIKRHFQELTINIAEQDITVVGIGDMSGDVFGNGMLYTPHIKLIAAFDHRNIFIDPNPNTKLAYDERRRLFQLPASSWEDYDSSLISTGGGIYKRSAKSINLSKEAQQALGIATSSLSPNELIRAILQAPIDLLWNGGIGTYVKASSESHAAVGDKANELCRINGNELRCRVAAEGGNLGFTQLARIEYANLGGLINTDFIDNSAGVDCSDHEVNIKILLNQEIAESRLTEKERNDLLASMTNDVANLVLKDNYQQALAMSYANFYSTQHLSLYISYLKELEEKGVINRAVENLPDEKTLLEKMTANQGLSRPELAVLLAYTKIHIKNEILESDIPDDLYLGQIIASAFPAIFAKSFAIPMNKHSLRREIVATQLSNQIVNEMGITFVYRVQNETGASVSEIIRAYIAASQTFEGQQLQHLVTSLQFKIPLATQYELLKHIRHLINLATRWYLRHIPLSAKNMATVIDHYATGVSQLRDRIPTLMAGSTKLYLENLSGQFIKAGLSEATAKRVASSRALYTALNIIHLATKHQLDLLRTAQVYFLVGEQFNLLWFRDQIANDTREGYWYALSRYTLRDELDILQKALTVAVIRHDETKNGTNLEIIEKWMHHHARAMTRWNDILKMLHSSTSMDYVMFFIALRELASLIQAHEIL